MKITTHESRKKKDVSYTLTRNDGMFVQLSKTQRLEIEKGDSIRVVALALGTAYGLGYVNAKRLAAYYFALVERRQRTRSGNFRKDELSADPKRRLLK